MGYARYSRRDAGIKKLPHLLGVDTLSSIKAEPTGVCRHEKIH